METKEEVRKELLRSCAAHFEGERGALPLLAGVLALAAVPSAGPAIATLWFVSALFASGLLVRLGGHLLSADREFTPRQRLGFFSLRSFQSALWASLAFFATGSGDPATAQLPWLFVLGALLVVFCVTAGPLPGLAFAQGAPLFAAAMVLASRQSTLPLLPYVAGFAPALAMMLHPLRNAALRDARARIELRRAVHAGEVANRELAELAATDELTRVSNRRGFLVRANEEIARARRYRQAFSLMMVDIDHFKGINDQHGHSTGDEILRVVADLLEDSLRETDHLARFGGDEFALLLPGTLEDGAKILAERLRGAIEGAHFRSGESPVEVTMSCGIACFDERDKDVGEIIERADTALYRAKRNGRNRIEVHGGARAERADAPEES